MIKKVNQTCKKLNDTLGISVELPTPKRNAIKTAAMRNFIVGTGLVAAGIILPSKSCVVLGGIGIISSAVLRKESRDNDSLL